MSRTGGRYTGPDGQTYKHDVKTSIRDDGSYQVNIYDYKVGASEHDHSWIGNMGTTNHGYVDRIGVQESNRQNFDNVNYGVNKTESGSGK